MSNSPKKRNLGRGLSSLMADIDSAPITMKAARADNSGVQVLPIEKVFPNPDQPRRDFDQDELNNLGDSITTHGLIQPILVRPMSGRAGDYQIVAGERRWRAAQLARLNDVPVIIREMDEQTLMEVAIIENVQRSDLNAIEEALGYKALMDRFGHTQEKMASTLGKSRSHIANLLRLLNLPDSVQAMVRDAQLSNGHARALVGRDDALSLAKQIIAWGLSVRDIEKIIKKRDRIASSKQGKAAQKDSDTRALEADLKAQLKMNVDIEHNADRQTGKLVITYETLDQLDLLCALLSTHKGA